MATSVLERYAGGDVRDQEMAERHRVGVGYESTDSGHFDADMFTTGTIELLRNGHENNVVR